MTDTVEETDVKSQKKSKLPLILGSVFAIIGGVGAFYAVDSGLVLGGGAKGETEKVEQVATEFPEVAFVPIEPIVVSLAPTARNKHLRFRAQLEVLPEYEAEVARLSPRILDVLNNYLRAVEAADLEHPAALIKLRAQMLRRIQIVVGQGKVNDLLVMEFVLN